MKARWVAASLLFFLGLLVGVVATLFLAQRASYIWGVEQMARLSSALEMSSKDLAAKNNKENAEITLGAALRVRKFASETAPDALFWPIDTPFSMLPSLLVNGGKLPLNHQTLFENRATSFMLECAIIDSRYSDATAAGRRATEIALVNQRYPGSNAKNCDTTGRAYWSNQ